MRGFGTFHCWLLWISRALGLEGHTEWTRPSLMVTGLDEEDDDMLVGDASPPDSFFEAEFAESTLLVEDTLAKGAPRLQGATLRGLLHRAVKR